MGLVSLMNAHPRSDASPTPTQSTSSSPEGGSSWVTWLTAGIAIGGLYLVAKSSPMSQGEWNDRYGRPR